MTDGQAFKADSQLYRFRKDDGTFSQYELLVVYVRAQRIYNRLVFSYLNSADLVTGVT